jgi:predicted N-acetyltransferase YhbS
MSTLLIDDLAAEQAGRWSAADRLIPPSLPLPLGQDAAPPFVAHDLDGRLVGVGAVLREQPAGDDVRLTYTAADHHQLMAYVGGPDPGGALDRLLSQWREDVAAARDLGGDSSAVVAWPSRDTVVQGALVRHGLAPLAGLGVRPARAPTALTAEDTGSGGAVRVRLGTPDDIEAVFQLRMGEVRWATQFGLTTFRPHTEARIREEVVSDLTDEDVWTWVAERGGDTVGTVVIAPPPVKSAWVSWMVNASPVAYVSCLSVVPGQRGTGVGTLLAGAAHRRLDDSGVAALLGYYSLANPLSVPFWNRLGFRPLWTMWETRPVTTLR